MHTWFIGWGLVLLTAWAGYDARPTTHCITFDDRVRAQEAIERVYYEHRLWPKENPGPKPPFESMIGLAQIEAKVEDYLKKSVALDQYWHRPIQPEQLQAEMDRMAKQTKDPDTLRELFAALNNDPYLIAEGLARPVLADRLIRNWYSYDARFHAGPRAKAEQAFKELKPEQFSTYPEGKYYRDKYVIRDPAFDDLQSSNHHPDKAIIRLVDSKQLKSIKTRFSSRQEKSYWRETENAFYFERVISEDNHSIEIESRCFDKKIFIEWWTDASQQSSSAPRKISYGTTAYHLPHCSDNLSADDHGDWINSSLYFVPWGAAGHTALWTGTEMLVWGGHQNEVGLRYNPSTEVWTYMSYGENNPYNRGQHSAIWTGKEMIIWGGVVGGLPPAHDGAVNTGGSYDPISDTWKATSIGENCPQGRFGHTAVWTGKEMIIWGGADHEYNPPVFSTGGRYDPSSDSWISISVGENCPSAREHQTAIWTGQEMIVWGGRGAWDDPASYYQKTGGRYDPLSNSWSPTSLEDSCPAERAFHTAIWTGEKMIIWGGIYQNGSPNYLLQTGSMYDPQNDSWHSTSIENNCPEGRYKHTALWTGTEMIVWGGLGQDILETGGKYDPSSDSWQPTSVSANCPGARYMHSAVWTGTEMIVWGGTDGDSTTFYSGGRYNPLENSWLMTPMNSWATGRSGHNAVWTGMEMIISGGKYLFDHSDATFVKAYYPYLDSWSNLAECTDCSQYLIFHSAIWTGSEMIIWGGQGSPSDWGDYCKNSGGRYNPTLDSWIATSIEGPCPSPRSNHTAIWSGTEMIIWGGSYSENYSSSLIYLNTGGRYNPQTDQWTATSIGTNCPISRRAHTAVWTGEVMIIWGGYSYDFYESKLYYLNSGGRYSPSDDTWLPSTTNGACPSARRDHSAIWTGQEMIVWGGFYYDGSSRMIFNSGARYYPKQDNWISTSIDDGCPPGRSQHTSIWTGKEMIVWGGETEADEWQGLGGRYDIATDSWISTSVGQYCPIGFTRHTAVWTGRYMIVFGSTHLQPGGIYRPYTPHDRPVEKP